jgi:hypothetical protein
MDRGGAADDEHRSRGRPRGRAASELVGVGHDDEAEGGEQRGVVHPAAPRVTGTVVPDTPDPVGGDGQPVGDEAVAAGP